MSHADFVHLHLHTEYSLLDAACRLDKLAEKAHELKFHSMAITDHGVGIPADELPAMFRRFFRASTAQGIAGTGIGLNFVKEIVAMHGGRIDVASTVGRGSTFTLRMPLAPAARGEIRPAAA